MSSNATFHFYRIWLKCSPVDCRICYYWSGNVHYYQFLLICSVLFDDYVFCEQSQMCFYAICKFCERKPPDAYNKEYSSGDMASNMNNSHNTLQVSMGGTNVVCIPNPRVRSRWNNMAHKCIVLMAMPIHLPQHARRWFLHKCEPPGWAQ